MDQITKDRIATAHPKIREQLLADYLYANNKLLGKGVRLRFSWVYRTAHEQRKLYFKRPRVTRADKWQSIHNYGLAFDIVLLYDKNGDGRFEEASWDRKRDGDNDNVSDWLEVTKYFESKGYRNGFISNGKKWDFPHFQKSFGHNWRTLKAKVDKGEYTKETIKGKEYIYPNI